MITVLLIIGFVLLVQIAFAQGPITPSGKITDIYGVSAANDTQWIQRNTDSLYNRISGVITFTGRVNPRRFIPWWMISYYPAVLRDTTALSDSIGKKLDKIAFAGAFAAALTSGAVNTALGYTPYNGTTNPNGYVTTNNVYNAGFGVTKTGTEPSATFSVNQSDIMTVSRATDSIASLDTKINGKVPSSRNITINGLTKNLSVDQTWTVSGNPAYTFNNNVSRTLNSNYTISATKDAHVTYSIALSVTNPLLAGSSTASAFLEYSTDGGSNWITVSNAVNSSSVALTVTVQIAQPNTFVLSGVIPANALVRIRSTTSGTASVTYTRGQEVF